MNRFAFILDEFELKSPGQQLLDRFLIGYNHDGRFHAAPSKVVLSIPRADQNPLVQSRQKEFGLELVDSPERAVSSADAVFVTLGTAEFRERSSNRLPQALAGLTPKQNLFLDASFLPTRETLRNIRSPVVVSRPSAHLFPLPQNPLSAPAKSERGLIIAQGVFPEAELDALFALKPYLDSSWMQAATPTLQHLPPDQLWDIAYSPDWRPLLQGAISRSNNIKGDPDKDGRTQDIVGLQLIEKLAPKARGWRLQHSGGMELLILICDGALTDFNFALEANAQIHSAQLYHGQASFANHYDEMAAWIIRQISDLNRTNKTHEAHFISEIIGAMKADRA